MRTSVMSRVHGEIVSQSTAIGAGSRDPMVPCSLETNEFSKGVVPIFSKASMTSWFTGSAVRVGVLGCRTLRVDMTPFQRRLCCVDPC